MKHTADNKHIDCAIRKFLVYNDSFMNPCQLTMKKWKSGYMTPAWKRWLRHYYQG